jgi:hypothetical protein
MNRGGTVHVRVWQETKDTNCIAKLRGAAIGIASVFIFLGAMAQLGSAHSPNQQAQTTQTWVKMAYCGAAPEKPPLEKLFFDVWVHNPTQEQSWVLLPLSFYERATRYNNDEGIDAIEVLAAKKEQLKLVRFRGRFRVLPDVATDAGGFQGMLLPGGATVFVHNLVIEFWGRPNGPLPVTAVLARGITIGGQAVQHRFHIPLQSNTISPEPLSLADSWHTPDWGEVPAAIVRTGQFSIPNALAKTCADTAQQPSNAEGSAL